MRGILILKLHTNHCFRFLSALNENSTFDLVNVIVKVINISPPETIFDAIGQTLDITKALAFGITSSIRINFTMTWQKYLKTTKAYNNTYRFTITIPKDS